MVEGWRRTVSQKPIEEIQKWRAKIIAKSSSKLCTAFLDLLALKLNCIIEREKPIGNKFIDGFIENKLLIEFYGDYWHCNPNVYNVDDYILQHHKQILVKDIWNLDSKRNEYILKQINLPLLIVWERSFIQNKDNVINEIVENFLKGVYKNGNIYVI